MVGNQYWHIVSLMTINVIEKHIIRKQRLTLENKFAHMLRYSFDMKLDGLIVESVNRRGVNTSVNQAYRAKIREIELIQGFRRDRFSHLRSYAHELLMLNTNNNVVLRC